MRDYKHVERYLNQLVGAVYPQPPDAGHTDWFLEVYQHWLSKLQGLNSVLDVGCGQGQFSDFFAQLNCVWTGVTLGEDYFIAKEQGKNVYNADFTFLPFEDDSFDLVFARHSLEHSFSPILSMMEWRRVSKQWLCVILPNPDHFGYNGKNHLSVMNVSQFKWWSEMAGWHVIWEHITPHEYRFMLEKGNYKVE